MAARLSALICLSSLLFGFISGMAKQSPKLVILLFSPYRVNSAGHNLPDKSCVADTAMQIELA